MTWSEPVGSAACGLLCEVSLSELSLLRIISEAVFKADSIADLSAQNGSSPMTW